MTITSSNLKLVYLENGKRYSFKNFGNCRLQYQQTGIRLQPKEMIFHQKPDKSVGRRGWGVCIIPLIL